MSNSDIENIANAISNGRLPSLDSSINTDSGSMTSSFGFRDVMKNLD